MRELTDHKQNEANKQIFVEVVDGPGHGGASRIYYAWLGEPGKTRRNLMELSFQNGPIKEVGGNGITHEVLLAILIDRMRGFQSGKYACTENEMALRRMKEALVWLNKRTQGREARGVERTHDV